MLEGKDNDRSNYLQRSEVGGFAIDSWLST